LRTIRLTVATRGRREARDITSAVERELDAAGLREGFCLAFVAHTTCALALQESGEGTAEDLLECALKAVPDIRFRHGHDPTHAPDHIASSLLGQSVIVPVSDGKLALGQWQRVLLLEFNGPRRRALLLQFHGE
jgi:secondary thiamine-phosphate synthase enzyme